MKKRNLLLFGFLVVAVAAKAQYNETIRSGRPGQAIVPFTVGKGVFQNQSGIQFRELRLSESTLEEQSGESVFRVGLLEQFELGAQVSYLRSRWSATTETMEQNGIDGLSIRARSNIFQGKGIIPSIGWQVNVGLPVVSENYNQDHLYPKITFMTGQSLLDWLSLTTNAGLAWNGFSADPTSFYIFNFGFSASDKLGFFAEHYATIAQSSWNPRFDAGAAYLINNNIQLDISGGYHTDSDIESDFFVSTGVSWRLKRKDDSQPK